MQKVESEPEKVQEVIEEVACDEIEEAKSEIIDEPEPTPSPKVSASPEPEPEPVLAPDLKIKISNTSRVEVDERMSLKVLCKLSEPPQPQAIEKTEIKLKVLVPPQRIVCFCRCPKK